ncbi:centrosomin isoform X2 [Ochlerotatus camptorhynchus]|uniref:centrosomin isoform X2 n=1 Tax=Ochlerotatus camptorhynchus TaxID=644619 RepID=UPI0031DF6686
MSGIFKYNPNRAAAASTPNRRSAFGFGFGGSPVQQQDATMDNSYSMGFRSPSMNTLAGQPTSPGPGRSLREHEEQMSALRKENFNLKLRIYFLEENAGIKAGTPGNISGGSGGNNTGIGHGSSTDGTGAQENLFKQNIDLKVEVESLRKDLQEKQDLLYQAAKAMEMMEEGQRKVEHHHREVISDMEHRIEMLQQEIKQVEAADRQHQQHGNQTRTGFNDTNLLDFLEKMEHREVNVMDKVQTMELENAIRQFRVQNDDLSLRIDDLHKQLEEKEHKINALELELGEMRFECAEMRDKLDKNDRSSMDAEVTRLKKDLFGAKSELADKLCQLDDTEIKLKEKSTELFKTAKMVEKLVKTITDQEKELSQLKRNSTISDPGTAAHPSSSVVIQQVVVDQNQQIVSQDEYDNLCLRLKAIQTKNDSLIKKLTGGGSSNDRNENIIIKQLNEEVIQAREEAEKAQRWRKECVDLCAISTARLEELAGFLDSLLRNKEFCGSLSMDRRKAIRKAVDRSLDLSRSLNMSISVTGFSLPDNSFANLSCLSSFLKVSDNCSLVEQAEAEKENRAQDQMIGSAEKVIEGLKAENRELRGQLEGRVGGKKGHPEARRKLIPLITEPVSDSEAWSEPDRDVSLARIGLEERSSLTNSGGKGKNASRGLGGVLQELSSTSENEGNVGHLRKQGVEQLKQLQDAIQEKDSKILEIQTRMVDLDNKLQEERMKASRTQVELENTRHVNQRLEKDNNEQVGQIKNNEKRLEELQREIQQKDESIEKLKKDRDQAYVDLRVAVMKQESLRTEYQDSQQKHKAQIDSLLAQERQRLENLRQDLNESFNNQLKAKQASFDASLTESYISKNIYQEKMKELEEVHFRLEDAHLNLVNMSELESKLKQQMKEAEKSVQAMRKTLDETTLQASKAALERTKAMNEKRLLEDELEHVRLDLETVKTEKNELNTKLVEAQTRLQQCQRSPPTRLNSSSGYTSEEVLVANRNAAKIDQGVRQGNSSPDLGIESDAGRLSNPESIPRKLTTVGSDEATSPARPLLKTLELTKSMSNLLMDPKEEAKPELNSSASAIDTGECRSAIHDCAKIEADFAELKRRYKQTRRHLELAYDSIKSSNKRKEQVERDIKQQIQKTNVVLKTVRTNMTNELEKSSSGSVLSTSPSSTAEGGHKS